MNVFKKAKKDMDDVYEDLIPSDDIIVGTLTALGYEECTEQDIERYKKTLKRGYRALIPGIY